MKVPFWLARFHSLHVFHHQKSNSQASLSVCSFSKIIPFFTFIFIGILPSQQWCRKVYNLCHLISQVWVKFVCFTGRAMRKRVNSSSIIISFTGLTDFTRFLHVCFNEMSDRIHILQFSCQIEMISNLSTSDNNKQSCRVSSFCILLPFSALIDWEIA